MVSWLGYEAPSPKWLKFNRFYFWLHEKLPFTSFFHWVLSCIFGVCLHTSNFWEVTSGVARSLHRGRPHDTPADGFLLLHLTSQYPIISLSLLVSRGVSRMMTDRPLKLSQTTLVTGLSSQKWFSVNCAMLLYITQMLFCIKPIINRWHHNGSRHFQAATHSLS